MCYLEKGSIFEIKNREEEFELNVLAKPIIEEKRMYIGGRGECECAGYAAALGVPIIISDNVCDFEYLDEYIMLTHYDIISICVNLEKLSLKDGIKVYNGINSILDRPSGKDFSRRYSDSLKRFEDNGWNEVLNIK